MVRQRILVSCADFSTTEGFITCLDFDGRKFQLLNEIIIPHPNPKIAVQGKGISGMCHGSSGTVWAAFSNLIAHIRLDDGTIIETIQDDKFNDLHDLHIKDGKLVAVNSGNESIDFIDIQSGRIERFDLLGDSLREKTRKVTVKSDTKPHLHHVSTITYNDQNEMVLAFFKQQRIINIDNWGQIGPKMPSPIHDLQFSNNKFHWTTICGKKYTFDDKISVIDLAEHGLKIGWTRGLRLLDSGFIIGTTAIRESNVNFFSHLTKINNSEVKGRISWIPPSIDQKAIHYEFENSEKRKVYSII